MALHPVCGNCHIYLTQNKLFQVDYKLLSLLQTDFSGLTSEITATFFREWSHIGDLKAASSDDIKIEVFTFCAVGITARYRVKIQGTHPGTSHAEMEDINLLIRKGRLTSAENHYSGALTWLLQKFMIIEWNPGLWCSPARNKDMEKKKKSMFKMNIEFYVRTLSKFSIYPVLFLNTFQSFGCVWGLFFSCHQY